MPNNCLNHLHCSEEQASKLRALFLKEDNRKTFQIVCPMPELLLKSQNVVNLEAEVELVRKELAGEFLTTTEKEALDCVLDTDANPAVTHRDNALLALKAKEETGYADWYNWSLANWGTKWEPYSTFLDEDEELAMIAESDEDPSDYEFFTAWSSPDVFYKVLATHVDFDAYYAETGAKIAGKFQARNGILQEEHYEYDVNPDSYKMIVKQMEIWDDFEDE